MRKVGSMFSSTPAPRAVRRALPLFVIATLLLAAPTAVAMQAAPDAPGPEPAALAPGSVFPPVTQRDPVVSQMIGQVQQSTVYQYDGDLSGEWPVTVDGGQYTIKTRNTNSGTPIQKATKFVGAHLQSQGLTVEYHQWLPSSAPNVIGQLTGETQPANIYMITAHLDDMPGGSTAPGADDNASGSVAVLVASDILARYRWNCTLRFALWTGEEQGLLGSDKYAQRAQDRNEQIRGVLNFDMIAWNTPGSPRDVDLHAKASMPGTVDLANQVAGVIDVYDLDLIPEVRTDGTGASDHASFWKYGFDAILGIEDYYPNENDFHPDYHTTGDLLSTLDMAYFTEYVKAGVGGMAHMANCLLPGPVTSVSLQGDEVRLAWPGSANDEAYEVHRSTTPYFAPAAASLRETVLPPYGSPVIFDDATSGAGDPAVNHFYQVRAMKTNRGAVSATTGEFDFALTAGAGTAALPPTADQ